MVGTGGAHKLRWATGGRGKRGGLRVITLYGGQALPAFLVAVFGKGEKANLMQAERNELRKLLRELVVKYFKG